MLLITAFGVTAVRARETAFLEFHRVFLVAVGAFHTFLLCAVLDEFFQSAAHTVAPRIDALLTEVEAGNNVDDVIHGNTVAQQRGSHLGVVPEFLIETTVQSAQNHFVACFVLIDEVVGLGAVFVTVFHDNSMFNPFRQQETLVTRLSCEDFVGFTIIKAYVGHPVLVVVLEMDDISIKLAGAFEVFGFLDLQVNLLKPQISLTVIL